jgi:hypothetical protein
MKQEILHTDIKWRYEHGRVKDSNFRIRFEEMFPG